MISQDRFRPLPSGQLTLYNVIITSKLTSFWRKNHIIMSCVCLGLSYEIWWPTHEALRLHCGCLHLGVQTPPWETWIRIWTTCCPACRTTLVATRFRVAVICPIIQVPHCIRVFFYFVWFVFINHIFQFYYELCTYCNILDIYLS